MKLCVKEKKIKKKTTGNQTTENANRFENNVGAIALHETQRVTYRHADAQLTPLQV